MVTILQTFGVALGNRLNESLDPYVFMRFYDRWIDPFVRDRSGLRPMERRDRTAMVDELRSAVASHLDDAKPARGSAWGWKSPRSIFVLPLLGEVYPQLRFVHVVRDPRDMAFSSNQRQLEAHGDLYLSPEERAEPLPIQSALLWKRVNNEARTFGTTMGDRYLLLRFEGLCREPGATARALAAFAEVTAEAGSIEVAAARVVAPSSLGRWKKEDPTVVARIGEVLGDDLAGFGYGG